MSVVAPQFTELVNGSDFIVRAVVKSVRSEWREKQGQRHIYTLVELEVREVIAGTPPQPLILQVLGGQVGDEAMVIDGAPQFKVGQEDILFIRGNGRQFYPLTAVMHGRYPIRREPTTNREYVVRSNDVPLKATDEVAQPMAEGSTAELQRRMTSPAQAMTPSAFIQQIRAAIGAKTPNARVN